MKISETVTVNEQNHLTIDGKDAMNLIKKYGTPLYVYNVSLIRERARLFVDTFRKLGVKAQVAYASKAFSCIAMCQLAAEEKMSLDVVSGGELFTALRAGFPADRIHFHGNNKSESELRMAINAKIGCIVVDNFYEIECLKRLCGELDTQVSILLRVAPGVEAHTHEYVVTGQEDSKFGFDLFNGQAEEALMKTLDDTFFNVLGVHSHIGSQMFETEGFVLAAEKIFNQLLNWKKKFGYFPEVLNLGGGFGIRYTDEDRPLPVSDYVEVIVEKIKSLAYEARVDIPEIWIEPGRSIVGDAGMTLYKLGSQKTVPNTRQYLTVDGGMGDNIRTALYDAKYTGVLVNRVYDQNETTYAIAGKCCESGDMLIWDLPLPTVKEDDYLAVFSTGAYCYSMASNYNRLPRPAVVFVENGEDKLVVKRESYEDIILNDLQLNEI
ncbi:MAG: diaminopimelate decarboxylase [Bacillales bacterium]|nr:diaminopimelate decarboxylase [Bacillales bacterium]